MFDLIESCPERREGLGWTGKAASVAIHMFLISAAVAATREAVRSVTPPTLVEVPLAWPQARPLPAQAGLVWGTTPVAPVMAPVSIPFTIPDPALPVDVPTGGDPTWVPPCVTCIEPGPGPIAPAGGLLPPMGSVVDVRVADVQPELLSHPALHYPDALRQAGLEGRVLVETVLDTLGRAETGSAHVVVSPHPLFDREALSVVLGSRYRPARLAGRAVRVRVRVPVTFAIRR